MTNYSQLQLIVAKEVEGMQRHLRMGNLMVHGVKYEFGEDRERVFRESLKAVVEVKCSRVLLDDRWRHIGVEVVCDPIGKITGLWQEARRAIFQARKLARAKLGWGIDEPQPSGSKGSSEEGRR